MKRLLLVAALLAGMMPGANVQPLLTGGGKILFPENATPATISASSGALTIASGGSNQFLGLTPSGTGEVRINANTATLPASTAGALLHLGNADGTATRLIVDAFASNPVFQFRRYDGTAALPTAVQSGEVLGTIFWGGYGSTAVAINRAQFRAIASENWTDAAQGASVSVVTTPTGGTATAEVARFFGSGGFSVNSTFDPGAGIINANSGFAKGGTAGTSATYTFPCSGSLTSSGGITTAATSSSGGVTGALTLTLSTQTIQYKDWSSVNQSATVVTNVTLTTNSFTGGCRTL